MKTCMFTGHRPQKLPFKFNEHDERCIKLKECLAALIKEKIKSGFTHFITGMALGTDKFAAEIVLSLKSEFPNVTLEAVIPCANQSSRWNKRQIELYNLILKQCDNVTTLQQIYTPDCMQKRNRYMVEHSDCVIAIWDGTSGGTSRTVNYAVKKNLPVSVLHPYTFSVMNI